jgi:hypothetical protein
MKRLRILISVLAVLAAVLVGMPATAGATASGLDCSDQVERNGWSFTVYPGADDTAAIQCALDEASQLGSMPTINLMAGTYTVGFIDGAPDQRVRIRGAGAGATTIVPAADLDCVARFNDIGTVPLFQFVRGSVQLIKIGMHANDVSCAEPWLDGPFFDFENVKRQDLEALVSMRPQARSECVPGEFMDTRGKLLVRDVEMTASPAFYGLNFPFAEFNGAQFGVVYGQPGQFGNQESFENLCISDLLAGGFKVVSSSFTGFATAVQSVGVNGPIDIVSNHIKGADEGVFIDATDGGKVTVRRNVISEVLVGVVVLQGPPPFEFERTQIYVERNHVDSFFDGIVVAAPTFNPDPEAPVSETPSQTVRIRDNAVSVVEGVGIVADGQNRATVVRNEITGTGVFGMVLVTTNSVARDNDMSAFSPIEANVLLPPPTTGNTVILAEGETVIDEGFDNDIRFR